MSRRKNVADKLRAAIARAERKGMTRYRIAQVSGVSQCTLGRFVNDDDRQLRLDVAEAIAEAIGYRLDLIRWVDTVQ